MHGPSGLAKGINNQTLCVEKSGELPGTPSHIKTIGENAQHSILLMCVSNSSELPGTFVVLEHTSPRNIMHGPSGKAKGISNLTLRVKKSAELPGTLISH